MPTINGFSEVSLIHTRRPPFPHWKVELIEMPYTPIQLEWET